MDSQLADNRSGNMLVGRRAIAGVGTLTKRGLLLFDKVAFIVFFV